MGEFAEDNKTSNVLGKVIMSHPINCNEEFEAIYNFIIRVIFILVGIKLGVRMLTCIKNKLTAQTSALWPEETTKNSNNVYSKNNIRKNTVHC